MPEINKSIFKNSVLLNKHFNPDAIQSPIVPIYAFFSNIEEHSLRSKMHSHSKGQLVYIKSGTATVRLKNSTYSILPNQIIWLPRGMVHNIILRNNVEFHAIYIDQKQFPQLSKKFEIFSASELLEKIIETICSSSFYADWMAGTEFHLQSILIREMQKSSSTPQWPEFPKDRRVCDYLMTLHEKGEIPPRLNDLASNSGASERTIYRLFVQETGLNYQKWRQQVRLMIAIELLSSNKSITEIAHHLEFSTTSAFISFFKIHQKITPKKYRNILTKPVIYTRDL